ncbi:MAG: phosphatase PAP2 family protein [Anaeromyxobacter sp.]
MRPSESVSLACLAALVALSFVATPSAPGAAAGYAVLFLATWWVARRLPQGAFVRDWFPVVTIVAAFTFMEPVITGVHPRLYDAALAGIDDRHLAGLVSAWRGALGRPALLTDAAYVLYVSYYFVPLTAVGLARLRGPEETERVTFTVLLAFWGSYAGYFLVPAAGPRIPYAEEAAALGGGAVSDGVRWFLHVAEKTRLDAFPSGHTAISLVAGVLAIRLAPRFAPAIAAWVVAVIFTTVYIHVHYAIDVVAGVGLAAGALLGAAPASRAVAAAQARLSRRLAGTPRRAAGA